VPSAGGVRARTTAALAATIAALALAGCGLASSGSEPRPVDLLVTAGYGQRPVGGPQRTLEVTGTETAADLLRHTHTSTRGGGSLFVNGVEPDKGAAKTNLHRGDVVWWDRDEPAPARRPRPRVGAVIGSFPEPFVHGIDGKRIPARLECAPRPAGACDVAAEALADAGTGIVGRSKLGTIPGEDTIVVLVGLWPDLRADFAARQLEAGPRVSGVYARIAHDGRSIALLDAAGRTARTMRAGTGLIAATRFRDDEPTWVVTGTDAAGLRAAASALTADALRGKFAVAIRDEVPTALPLRAG
jgi:hypothetical protein